MRRKLFEEKAGRARRWFFWAALCGGLLDTVTRLLARTTGIPLNLDAFWYSSTILVLVRSALGGAAVAILSLELLRRTRFGPSETQNDRQHFQRVVALATGLTVLIGTVNLIARPKVLYRSAWSHAHQSNYPDAMRGLDRLLASYPGHVDGYLERAWVRTQQGDHVGAIADATKAIELDGSNARAYYRRGWARGATRDHEGAIADLTRAIELDRGSVAAYVERGWARGQTGDYEGELADTTAAIGLDPNNVPAYQNRGWARTATNDLEGAVADFSRVIELDPKNANAYLGRGKARHRSRDFRGSVQDWEAALRLDPALLEEIDEELAEARATMEDARQGARGHQEKE